MSDEGDAEKRAAQADAEAMAVELGRALARTQAQVDAVAARRMRHLEGGLGLAILAGFLGRWVQVEVLTPKVAPLDAGKGEVERLILSGQAPLAGAIFGGALLLGLIALVGLAVAAARLPGPGDARARLRAWWTARSARLREGPSLALFLVAFGTYYVAPILVIPLLPMPTLVVGGAAPVPVRVRPFVGLGLEPGGDVDIPGLPKDRLRIVAVNDGARLLDKAHVHAAAGREPPPPLEVPVRVDGVAFVGSADLRAGAVIEVGDLRAHLEAVGPAGRRDRIALSALGQALGLLFILFGAWRFAGPQGLPALGLVRDGLGAEVRRGVIGALALLPVYLMVLAGWAAVGRALGVPGQSHSLIEEVARSHVPGLWAVIILQAAVVAPIAEEVVFRGLLLPGYARVVGPLAGVVASSLVFGALHQGFQSLVPIGLVGAACALVAATSPNRSLVGAIVAHVVFNGVTLAAVFAALK